MPDFTRACAQPLLAQLPTDGSISIAHLRGLEQLHPTVAGFLDRNLAVLVYAGLDALKTRFELPAELWDASSESIRLTIMGMGTVSITEATQLILSATEDAIAYRSAPRQFLLDALTRGRKTVTLGPGTLAVLTSLGSYPHLEEVLTYCVSEWIESGFETISAEQLAEIIERIDSAMFVERDVEYLATLLGPLQDLFMESIPVQLLSSFLAEKRLLPIERALRQLGKPTFSATEVALVAASTLVEIRSPAQQHSDTTRLQSELRAVGVHLPEISQPKGEQP